MLALGGVGLDVFYGGFTLLNSYGPWASINGVGISFYDIPLEVEFPRSPNPPRGCSYSTDRLWDWLSRVEKYALVLFLFGRFILYIYTYVAAQWVCS